MDIVLPPLWPMESAWGKWGTKHLHKRVTNEKKKKVTQPVEDLSLSCRISFQASPKIRVSYHRALTVFSYILYFSYISHLRWVKSLHSYSAILPVQYNDPTYAMKYRPCKIPTWDVWNKIFTAQYLHQEHVPYISVYIYCLNHTGTETCAIRCWVSNVFTRKMCNICIYNTHCLYRTWTEICQYDVCTMYRPETCAMCIVRIIYQEQTFAI